MRPRERGGWECSDDLAGEFVYGVNAKTVPSPYVPPAYVVP
jgi:hypothetical protein